ncbi:SH3 domain-containing protein [Flavobacterium sp. ANB]|uniref:SH3 domain-containing protein n=1 Tax=unclassified Flavobacterium TaxID=196869 RepID=UPI0012BA3351|nr:MULTISPECIES: SH3 domain-containing protein [unclassified Flavobacterium]MBF4518228.1 SH3 domain-containing protein [Flavobacterium sp. ANB]MTD71074.1 SH3 domain-containing protein [Flavobacterium sp. LC2016-13]
MKKYHSVIAILFCSGLMYSQDRYFINSDTRLYTSASTSAEFLGYFKYGAEVHLLSGNQKGWYKIQADNNNEGYVPSKFISESLNADDIKTTDKENPIIFGGNYHGSNHLFVLVAGLKARAQPDKNSKIREVLFTGDPVTVNYLPKNEDEWVNIDGSFGEEYAKFTLRKFLGKRPDLNVLIKNFDKLDVNNITERKTISERIVELAWNTNNTTLLPAYQRYYEVVKQLNDPKLLAETELNIALAKALNKSKKAEEIFAFSKKAEFLLKGIKTKSLYLSQTNLVKTFGKPTKKANVDDGCGIYLSDLFYYYPDLEVSVDEAKNQAEIVKVFINENNKLAFSPNVIFDNTLSEKAFIEKYGTYVQASLKSPHYYSIYIIDDSQFILEFKDGKLFSVEIFIDC